MRLITVGTLSLLLIAVTPQVGRPQDQTTKTDANPVALTNLDVVLMATSKFDDVTIQKVIESREVNFDLSVTALVKLKDAGVSQGVIQTMLDRDLFRANESAVAENSPPPEPPATATETPLSREQLAVKLGPGTYYWSDGTWIPLQQLTSSGGGAKHTTVAAVFGLLPQTVLTFRDPKAPLQIHENQPLFCVRLYDAPPGTLGVPPTPTVRDVAIARLDQKPDHRELQVTSGSYIYTYKTGITADRLASVNITSLDAATALINPKAPLRAGEYLIMGDPSGSTGFDFGYHPDH